MPREGNAGRVIPKLGQGFEKPLVSSSVHKDGSIREELLLDMSLLELSDRNLCTATRNGGAILEEREGWMMISKKIRVRRGSPRFPLPSESPAVSLEVAAGGAFLTQFPWVCKDGLRDDKEEGLHPGVTLEKEKENERRAK